MSTKKALFELYISLMRLAHIVRWLKACCTIYAMLLLGAKVIEKCFYATSTTYIPSPVWRCPASMCLVPVTRSLRACYRWITIGNTVAECLLPMISIRFEDIRCTYALVTVREGSDTYLNKYACFPFPHPAKKQPVQRRHAQYANDASMPDSWRSNRSNPALNDVPL